MLRDLCWTRRKQHPRGLVIRLYCQFIVTYQQVTVCQFYNFTSPTITSRAAKEPSAKTIFEAIRFSKLKCTQVAELKASQRTRTARGDLLKNTELPITQNITASPPLRIFSMVPDIECNADVQ